MTWRLYILTLNSMKLLLIINIKILFRLKKKIIDEGFIKFICVQNVANKLNSHE